MQKVSTGARMDLTMTLTKVTLSLKSGKGLVFRRIRAEKAQHMRICKWSHSNSTRVLRQVPMTHI